VACVGVVMEVGGGVVTVASAVGLTNDAVGIVDSAGESGQATQKNKEKIISNVVTFIFTSPQKSSLLIGYHTPAVSSIAGFLWSLGY